MTSSTVPLNSSSAQDLGVQVSTASRRYPEILRLAENYDHVLFVQKCQQCIGRIEPLNETNPEGETALLFCTSYGPFWRAELLFNCGANVSLRGPNNCGPVYNCIYKCKPEDKPFNRLAVDMINAIHPTDLDRPDAFGNAPLHWVTNRHLYNPLEIPHFDGFDNSDHIHALLYIGANVDVRDQLGRTPINIAVQRNLEDLVEIYLEADADLEITDNKGYTPVHRAA